MRSDMICINRLVICGNQYQITPKKCCSTQGDALAAREIRMLT